MPKVRSFVLFLSCLATAAQGASVTLKAEPVLLPGGPSPILMDYLAYDASTGRLWVPAGNTGKVDVVETSTAKVQAVEGFPTAQRGTRTVGPTSASVGAGVVYIGNRADSSICTVDAKSLRQQGCTKLEAVPDGIAYVPSTKELWVTAPREKALIILDVAAPVPTVKAQMPVGGQPEGFAVDAAAFFTPTSRTRTSRWRSTFAAGKSNLSLSQGAAKPGQGELPSTKAVSSCSSLAPIKFRCFPPRRERFSPRWRRALAWTTPTTCRPGICCTSRAERQPRSAYSPWRRTARWKK